MVSKNAVIFYAIALLSGTTQCHTQPIPLLTGKVLLQEGWKPMLYLVQPRNFKEIAANFSGVLLDSALIAPDGSFRFLQAPQPEQDILLELCIQKTGARFFNQLYDDDPALANYMPIVLSKGASLVLQADAAKFQASCSIKNPSPENLALLHLRDLRVAAFGKLGATLTGENAHEAENLLQTEDAQRQFQASLMAFADSCTQLFPALVAARWVSPTGDYERIAEFLVALGDKWREKAPKSPWAAQLCAAARRDRLPVLTGDVIPDFALPMENGDTAMLHSLLGKRITIVDIWASWCMPCRRENQAVLAPIWAEYNTKGLQIIGYSIDSSSGAWKAAIKKDSATWLHASHLSGDATPFLEALRISTIPANFIVDAQGKVMAKNLHGDALRAFVEDYLK